VQAELTPRAVDIEFGHPQVCRLTIVGDRRRAKSLNSGLWPNSIAVPMGSSSACTTASSASTVLA
jgi:hypothetical protein